MIKEIKENFKIKYENKHELYQSIESLIKPTAQAQKTNAEFLTPLVLAQEMCNKIPAEFFTAPKKVFDPCCGKGVFPLVIYDLFWHNLTIENADEKHRVILEDCLYFMDINPFNIFITKYLLDPLNQYKLNYSCGDTLKLKIEEEFKLEGFDAVVGNPPYNADQQSGEKRGGGDSLWNKFVTKSLQLNGWLKSNGYLVFIHPAGWRKPESDKSKYKGLFKLMTKNYQLDYLEIHGLKDGQKTFNAGTRYDWYLIQKTPKYKNTIIKDEKGQLYDMNLDNWVWLPNYNILEVNNLLGDGCEIINTESNYESRKKHVSPEETPEFKYPLIHSTPKSGTRYMYSSCNDKGHFGISKVMFGDSGIYDVIIDMEGKYGMTQHAMAIKVNNLEEANNIKKALLSKEFKDVLGSLMFGNFGIDWRLFTYFKKDFWKYFINN